MLVVTSFVGIPMCHPYILTRGSEKDYIKAAELTKRSAASQS
jgi:hypothetical protein